MRITGGDHRGREVKTPGGFHVRPTSSKVREAVFSMIASRVSGARVLDLFAGSGILGIEALSRGAGFTVFVEKSPAVASLLKDNLRNLGIGETYFRVVISDVFNYLKKASNMGKVFDIVFLDPPYRSRLGEKALSFLDESSLLSPKGLIVNEYRMGREFVLPGGFEIEREKKYGNTSIILCVKREAVI